MSFIGYLADRFGEVTRLASAAEISIAVVGAHLSGMTLNGELRALGGRFQEVTTTAPDYRLYALANTTPPKPGLVRLNQGEGTSIIVEIWALSAKNFGRFVANVPSPMAIGTIILHDGRTVKGFLAEPLAIEGSYDISEFGGWRAYTTSMAAASKCRLDPHAV